MSPMDYSSFSMTLIFATCETRRCVNVNIVDDLADEPDEVFDYILRPACQDSRITIRPDVGEIVITDNDGSAYMYMHLSILFHTVCECYI